jgi:hypothetical protein
LRRLLLHAARLVIPPLPRLGIPRPLDAQSPPPGYFVEFCRTQFPDYPVNGRAETALPLDTTGPQHIIP